MKIFGKIIYGMGSLVSLPFISGHTGDTIYDNHHMMDSSAGGMWIGPYWTVLLTLSIIVLILFIVWLVKEINQKDNQNTEKSKK